MRKIRYFDGVQSVFVTLGDCILFSGLLTGCVLVLRDFIDTITPALRVISYVNLVDSQPLMTRFADKSLLSPSPFVPWPQIFVCYRLTPGEMLRVLCIFNRL